MTDELDRLAAADPVPASPPATPAPAMTGPPGRGHRVPSRVLGIAGVLALGGVIAALVVAVPSGDDSPSPSARPLQVGLLDRASTPADALASVPRGIEADSVRRALRDGALTWFVGRRGRDGAVCLIGAPDAHPPFIARCADIRRGLVADSRTRSSTTVTGVVPDGIDEVTIGATTARVRGNVFVLRLPDGAADVVVLQGPAAPRIPRRPDVAVATRTGEAPAVAVSLISDPAVDAPLGPPGTLAAAAAVVPFTVLAPDPPPRGAPTVRWARGVPGIPARVELGYLRTSRPGITIVERPAPQGAPDAAPAIIRAMPDGAIVRTVRGGTVAEVHGPNDRLDDLLAVAASLRPVGP